MHEKRVKITRPQKYERLRFQEEWLKKSSIFYISFSHWKTRNSTGMDSIEDAFFAIETYFNEHKIKMP